MKELEVVLGGDGRDPGMQLTDDLGLPAELLDSNALDISLTISSEETTLIITELEHAEQLLDALQRAVPVWREKVGGV